MADNGRWFKLWCTALHDPDLDNLSIEDFGRWAKLGAFIREQGCNGKITISSPAKSLCAMLQINEFSELIACISRLPNMSVSPETIMPVSYSLKFCNWVKYQDVDILNTDVLVTVKKAGNKAVSKDIVNPDIKLFLDYAFNQFKSYCGEPLCIDGGRDGATVKKLLSVYGLIRLKELWDLFLRSDDPFIRTAGRSITVFKSVINKLVSGRGVKPVNRSFMDLDLKGGDDDKGRDAKDIDVPYSCVPE